MHAVQEVFLQKNIYPIWDSFEASLNHSPATKSIPSISYSALKIRVDKYFLLRILLSALLVLLLNGIVKGNQSAILIDSLSPIIPIPKSAIYLYEDTTGTLTFEQIQKKVFLPVSHFPPINKRAFQSKWWSKIIIQNELPVKQTLWVNISGKQSTAYIQEKNQPVQEFRTGNLLPKSKKAVPFDHKYYNYIPLYIPAESVEITLWAKVTLPEIIFNETDMQALINPFYAENEYNKWRKNRNIFNTIFQTTMLLLIFYCLIYFLNTKAAFAKYMLGYCLTSSLYFLNMENYFYQIEVVAENPIISNYILLSLANITIYFDLQMVRYYLDLKKHLPVWDRLFVFLLPLSIIFTLLSLSTYFLWDNIFLSYVLISGSFSFSFLLIRLVFVIRLFFVRNQHRFKIMRIALLFGVIFMLIASLGYIKSSFDVNFFFQLGLISYIFILILSLGKDAAIYQKEKIAAIKTQLAQQQAIENQQTKLKLIEHQEAFARTRNEELEKLDELKSHFFANVSHELRTPLTLMLGPIDSVVQSKQLANRDFTLLKMAQRNGKKLLKLVNEILMLNKLENKQLSLQEQPTLLYNFLNRIIANFESAAKIKEIEFILDYQPTHYLNLNLDRDKIEKVLNNLLSNALKFTPKGKAINLLITAFPNRVQIKVMDTGIGIPQTDLPHLFNRFYQSKQPNQQATGGTGIGLSLSKELTDLMKGKLWVESTLGEGSTFYFEFPLKKVVGNILDEAALEVKNWEKDIIIDSAEKIWGNQLQKTLKKEAILLSNAPTILIVEDNPDLLEYLRLILSKHYQILYAENGQVALELLQQQKKSHQLPNLIVSDLMMPIMDGFQLLKQLKSTDSYCAIPVIMLTARAALEDKLQALRIGVDDYLTKPFVEAELLARIANLLGNAQNRKNTIKTELAKSPALNPPTILITQKELEWLSTLEKTVQIEIVDFNFNIDRLAHTLAMSKRSLQNKIKRLTGLSSRDYIQEIRFAQARQLLTQQKKSSVKAIAYEVGLKDVAHFSKVFKERFGRLPSSYF